MKNLGNAAHAASAGRRSRTSLLAALSTLLALPSLAALATVPPSTEAWHVVRPGDTLEGLSARYLSDAKSWPELHRLNPEMISDPHWIYPGRRIRVRVDRPSARANAEVVQIARRVETRPAPVAWRPAGTGDLLLERDGIRTYEKASAQLLFDDGTAATLGENSLVFIRRQTPARAPEPRKEIEIERGQADFAHRPTTGLESPEIEVVVAAARARTLPEADGSLRLRSRSGDAGAQFMVYGGSSRVTAGGRSVDLAAGTGSTVAPQGPPTPAEALLPAPRLAEPATGGELGRDDPRIEWSAVAGAASYVVELCLDADCGSVVERQRVVATSTRLTEPLTASAAFVRVTAVAASGLDGFPSPAAPVSIVDSVRPPIPTLVLLDSDNQPIGAGHCLPAPPQLQVRALDARGQPLPWTLALDGVAGEPEAVAALTSTGPHELAVTAVDARGRTASSAPATFLLDLSPPVVTLPPVEGHPPVTAEPPPSRWRRRSADDVTVDPCATGLELSAGGDWEPVSCAAVAPVALPLDGEKATLRLRATGGSMVIGEFVTLAPGSELAVEVTDAGCGLASATVRIVASPHRRAKGRALLAVEVVDGAGHTSRADWHVGPGSRP
jgi:hypothetical protein